MIWLFQPLSCSFSLITACFTYFCRLQSECMSVPEVAAVYHACIFCPRGRRDGEIILSVPRGSRASPSESGSSQILSFSPSSHLGNGNLYLQTVGAGGEREILKSSLPSPLPPSIPRLGLRALSLSSLRPLAHSSSARVHHSAARRSGSAGPLPHPLFYFPGFGASERIQPPHLCSCVCIPRLLVTRGSRSTGFSGS